MIRAIISDCFGVLLLQQGQLFQEMYIPNYHEGQQKFIQLGYQHSLGHISTEQYLTAMAGATGLSLDVCRQHLKDQWVPNEPLVAYLQQLKGKYRLGLLSNAGDDMRTILPLEIQQLFDVVVLSAEVGLMKPDPALFKLMANRLTISPTEAVMIDDMPTNCAGAEAIGMKAIQYNSLESVKQKLKDIL